MCRTVNGKDINFLETYKNNIKKAISGGKMVTDITSALQKDGRGNICPVTVIMPTIAMEAVEAEKATLVEGCVASTNDIVERFMKMLDKKIYEAKDMLIERFNWICKQSAESAPFMYPNHSMCGYVEEEGIVSALKHGTLSLGQIGLAETLQILIGKDHTTEEGMELAKRIEQLYKDRCNEFKNKYKLNFGVYYTPRILWAA